MGYQLNPQIETMFLICNCPWDSAQKERVIAELEKHSFSGQDFYHRFFLPVETYYQTFQNHLVEGPGTAFLQGIDEVVLSVCAGVFTEHPDWFAGLSGVPEQAAGDCVKDMILSDSEYSNDDLFSGLDHMPELEPESKWQLLALQHKAKETLILIADAVSQNLPAYEKAAGRVAGDLEPMLQVFGEKASAPEKSNLFLLPEQIGPETTVIPTLALAMSVMILNNACFYGLLCDKITPGTAQITKEELMNCSKVLSEKSKLEILLCLKEKSSYSLEISELIGITPATVSHHMGILLTAGLVEFEKRNGKIYYKLADKAVRRYLSGCASLLLPDAEK